MKHQVKTWCFRWEYTSPIAENPFKPQFKKILGILLRYGLGVGILIYFFEKNDFHWDLLKSLFLPQIALLLIAIKFGMYFLVSLRWRRILKELSVQATVEQSVSFSFLAVFFTYFLPGNMSSDVAKSFFATRMLGAPGRTVLAIVLDRVIGLATLMILLAIGVAVFSRSGSPQFVQVWELISQVKWHYLLLAGILAVGFTVGLWFFVKRHPKFIEVQKVFLELRSVRFWFEVLFLSLGSHFLFALFLAVAARNLHLEHVDLLGCLIVFPLSTLAMIIPLTPGSLGVGQVIYQYMFDLYAGAPTQAAILFTALQVSDILFVIYGAWYFTRLLRAKAAS